MATNYNAGVGFLDENGGVQVASRFKLLYALAALGPLDAIDTTDLDTAGISEAVIVIKNGNSTTTRTVTIAWKDSAGNTMYSASPTAIATSGTVAYTLGHGAVTGGATAAFGFPLPGKIQLTCAAPASGAGNGFIFIWGR